MDASTNTFRTPGQFIRFLLQARAWTSRTLAIVLGMDESSVNKILADKRSVTVELALALSDVFDTPAERFLELQQSYALAKARIAIHPNPSRATRAQLFGGLPIAEMIKRGWLDVDDPKDVDRVEIALVKFFGVESVDQIEILPHVAKKTKVFTEPTPAQIAWLYRVREIASEMMVARYMDNSVETALSRLNGLLRSTEEVRHVPRIMNECGIRYVIVESLASAKIDGVCFWLNGRDPVIGMTLRHDRIDNFWFVLRHELEHVARQHGKTAIMLDAELEGEKAGTSDSIAEEERIANEAAADFCVPRAALQRFIARKSPYFNERDIAGFANTLNIHPGLVAGQLQYATGRYDRFKNHLAKIKSVIAPSAMVDGWGDVAPVGI